MEAFLVSAGVVALGVIGDKTQLLTLVADKLDDDMRLLESPRGYGSKD